MTQIRPELPRRRFLREKLIPGMSNFITTEAEHPKVVSSLILQVRPESLSSVCSIIAKIPHAEIHGDDGKSKAIVVLEADNDAELSEFMSMAAEIPGVVNVCMVFHHTDVTTNTFAAE